VKLLPHLLYHDTDHCRLPGTFWLKASFIYWFLDHILDNTLCTVVLKLHDLVLLSCNLMYDLCSGTLSLRLY
jgi:hypothetical protein